MTNSTFTLTLTLGNDAMRSGDDVQRALALTGAELANRYDGLDLPDNLDGTIRDANGNRVGVWQVAAQQTPEQIAERIAYDLAGTDRADASLVGDLAASLDAGMINPEDILIILQDAVRIARGEA